MKLKHISIVSLVLLAGCTKLDQSLNDSFAINTNSQGAADVNALLTSAYNSFNGLLHSQDQIF